MKTKIYVAINKDGEGFICEAFNKMQMKASIQINGKKKHLGDFVTEQEASEAYQRALKSVNLN